MLLINPESLSHWSLKAHQNLILFIKNCFKKPYCMVLRQNEEEVSEVKITISETVQK
jgi:hypothetical protein